MMRKSTNKDAPNNANHVEPISILIKLSGIEMNKQSNAIFRYFMISTTLDNVVPPFNIPISRIGILGFAILKMEENCPSVSCECYIRSMETVNE